MGNDLNVLEEEHRKFNTLIRDMAQYETNCGKFFAELVKIIVGHSELEERTISPLLEYNRTRHISGAKFDRILLEEAYGTLMENFDSMMEVHNRIRKMLEDARGETYKVEVTEVIDEICHHIKMEEEIAYPAAIAAGEILHFENRKASQTPM